MGKVPNRHFFADDIQMANRYVKMSCHWSLENKSQNHSEKSTCA